MPVHDVKLNRLPNSINGGGTNMSLLGLQVATCFVFSRVQRKLRKICKPLVLLRRTICTRNVQISRSNMTSSNRDKYICDDGFSLQVDNCFFSTLLFNLSKIQITSTYMKLGITRFKETNEECLVVIHLYRQMIQEEILHVSSRRFTIYYLFII